MTEKGGNRGRGRYIGKYLPYSNFPSTGGRELKGGGYRYTGIRQAKKMSKCRPPTPIFY